MEANSGVYVNGFVRLPCEVSSEAGVPHLIGVEYVSTRNEMIFS